MKETLLVKHAVGGRTFIDTGKQSVEYKLEQSGDNYKFTLSVPPDSNVEEILRWKSELNVFVFYESDDQPTKKVWFYVKDGPVAYDPQNKQLTIVAQSKIEYVPDLFHASV
ncbi:MULTISPECIES: hypothetical protein [Paenibacillus]|uniref:Uncharacterized protein n=1 Tax=Paenibacillus naphthalenovorans TaxID=162209 RepID=A0A0U2W5Z4_9BACL|nr:MULTISPECIES: hypothetical protein [Paenibacillus]ALS22933.1 hypothetical protein IJ22_25600 [Paenibacillus naphthalenovorans]NTZ17468.1 hypothetical protein [Paenibacillus sp. JMULE4]SDI45036.1 hypothetical protein SAMN05421868_106188 [Paenibacillus naphthalenovorans]